jgi:heme-degrading monooxygenase HmoA
MAYILVQHSVEDYERWKSGFDNNQAVRQAAGSKGGTIFRSAEDPNRLTILLEWDNLDNARAFAGSDELREAMQQAGVTGPPDLYFLNGAIESSV